MCGPESSIKCIQQTEEEKTETQRSLEADIGVKVPKAEDFGITRARRWKGKLPS